MRNGATPFSALLTSACLLAGAGCAPLPFEQPSVAEPFSITVTPGFEAPYQLQSTDVAPFTSNDVAKLTLSIDTVATDANFNPATPLVETPVVVSATNLPVTKDVLPADFAKPVTFSNLKHNTYYRIHATAYRKVSGAVISTSDTASYTDVPVTLDTTTVSNSLPLKVRLVDRQLSARLQNASFSLETAVSPSGDRLAPALAYDNDDHTFLTVWADKRSGTHYDLWAQRLNADGTPLNAEFALTTNLTTDQDQPAVVYNSLLHTYAVTWRDKRDATSTPASSSIYAQLVRGAKDATNGDLQGTNFSVYTSTTAVLQNPTVSSNTDSAAPTYPYMFAWQNDTNARIEGQLTKSNGTVLSAIPKSFAGPTSGALAAPTLGYDPTNKQFLLTYVAGPVASKGLTNRVICQIINTSGSLLNAAIVVTSSAASQNTPAMAFDPVNKRFLVAWQDTAGAASVTRACLVTDTAPGGVAVTPFVAGAGSAVASPTLPAAGADQSHPAVSFNTTSNEYLVAWADQRNNGQLYGERLTPAGVAIDVDASSVPTPFALTAGSGAASAPMLAYNPFSNQAFLAWRSTTGTVADVVGQVVDYFAK